jgi:hypothetical protein
MITLNNSFPRHPPNLGRLFSDSGVDPRQNRLPWVGVLEPRPAYAAVLPKGREFLAV